MISDEAVDAALQDLFPQKAVSDFNRDVWTPTIRTILEAAAPHIAAPVWQDGYDRGLYYDVDDELQAPNPYRSQK